MSKDKIRRCIYPRSSIEKSGHQAWEQVPRHSQGDREAVHELSSSFEGRRQNFESRVKTKSEHGNKYRGSPRATERRCMNHAQVAQVRRKGFLDNFRRSAAESRKQGQDKIRRCVYPRSSTEESGHKCTGTSTEAYPGVRERTLVAKADAGARILIYVIVCGEAGAAGRGLIGLQGGCVLG